MRILALDIGTKTVGLALSDELELIAQGYGTLARVGIRKDTGKVLDFIREKQCGRVVVGLPLRPDGADSEMTELARAFGMMLQNKLRSSGMNEILVVYSDERFTTAMAEKVLIEADLRRSERKRVIDQQAAVLILQNYLERERNRKQREALGEG